MRRWTQTLMIMALVVGLASTAQAIEPDLITFDDGTHGFDANPDCETIVPDGGVPGAYWNFVNRECDGIYYVRAWFDLTNNVNPAWIGDYTAMGPVRISMDVNINRYDYIPFWGPPVEVEEYRKLVVELRDYDDPYTDPETGYSWPWTSVQYIAGTYPDRLDGWKHFDIDIEDPFATEMPDGWIGFGGPEDPNTYMPQLPPDRTFTDVLQGIDEIVIHSIEPGYFYAIAFIHDIDVDNLQIREMPQYCNGVEATVWVDYHGMVHGGQFDGKPFNGVLHGSDGHDVIVGGPYDDTIVGRGGDDMICGGGGNDNINGQEGDDFIDGGDGDDNLIGQEGNDMMVGGEGHDHLNGGQGENTCMSGEILNNCGMENYSTPVVHEDGIEAEGRVGGDDANRGFGMNTRRSDDSAVSLTPTGKKTLVRDQGARRSR